MGQLHALVERAAARSRDRGRRLARAVARAARAHAQLPRGVARPPAARRLLAARLGVRELRRHPLPRDGDRAAGPTATPTRCSGCSSTSTCRAARSSGPWGHNDPVHGVPAPAVGSLGECVRFYDRWLKGIENGLDSEPQLIAWLQDSVPPRARYDERPGAGSPRRPGRRPAQPALRLHLAAGRTLEASRRARARCSTCAARRRPASTAAPGAPTATPTTSRSTSAPTTASSLCFDSRAARRAASSCSGTRSPT